jgi:diguanylate cyclase (GGDEF)-like protein
MTQVYLLANEWFGCRRSDITQLMRSINSDAKELSTLFEVCPRTSIDVDQILADAEERLRGFADSEEKAAEDGAASMGLAALADVLPLSFEQAEAFNGSLAVIDIGVDDFETIMTRQGPECRPAVRRAVEARIRSAMRSTDRLCLGEGDRFLLVLPGADIRDAATRAEAIRNAMNEGAFDDVAAEPLELTCSLGVAARTPDTAAVFMAPVVLLEAASRARRAARDGGGDAARVFTPAARAA